MRVFTVLAMVGLLAVPRPEAAVMQSSASVEWAVEIYESPTSAPPPDVAGPQGKKLYGGTLRAPLGQELRQFIPVGNQGKNASQVRGISILLTSKPADAGFETRLTVDTNLPFGQYDQKKDPVWLRAHTTWSAAAGAKEFITESTLASTIAPTGAPATTSTEPSIAREAAGVAVDAGVGAAAARIPGGSYIPSVGGLFNRNSTPQPRKTVLLFVVTTSPVAQPVVVRTPPVDQPARTAAPTTAPTTAPATTPPAAPSASALRAVPTPPSTASGRIPITSGLTIITAISDTVGGDNESIKRISTITDTQLTVDYAADLPVPGGGPRDVRELRIRRNVLREDLRNAREYMQLFGKNQPDVIPGTTALGVSSAVLADLKTNGRVSITVAAEDVAGAIGGLLGGLLGTTAPPELNAMSKWKGTITRVAAGPKTIDVIVNGTPTALPVLHAKGTVGDDNVDAEFFFLDDAENALSLKWSIGDARLQVVRIDYPVERAAAEEAPIEKALRTNGSVDVYGIYFDFASDRIKPESEPVLREIARVMTEHPSWRLDVGGHTDNIGDDASNLDLSKRRAASVKSALITRYHCDGARLQTNGFGASQPKDVNTTVEGRARNRRVELVRK